MVLLELLRSIAVGAAAGVISETVSYKCTHPFQ
ncbi:hypothetical protein KIPB_010647, partial [Kipferlia bialata]|eukprot:g10647.t1